MKYNRLGNSGLLVSEFCLGTPNFGSPPGADGRFSFFDVPQSRSVLDMAIDRGVNFLDTADYYGNGVSEEVLGKALVGRRNDVVIATKIGLRVGNNLLQAGLSRRHIMMSVDACLSRLNTDWIDVLILHRTDPLTPLQETLSALDAVVQQGKARYIGYSNWPVWLAAKAVGIQERNGWARFTAAQMYYSLAGRELEHDTIPFLEDAGIGLMAWSPLASGLLTGKYTEEDPSGGGGRRAIFEMGPLDRYRAARIVDLLRSIAHERVCTPAHVALAWLSGRPALASILIGVSSIRQLESNLDGAGLALTVAERSALNEVSETPEPYPNWYSTLMTDIVVKKALSGSDPSEDGIRYNAFYGAEAE